MLPKLFLITIFPAFILFSCAGKNSSGNKTNVSDVKTTSSDMNLTGHDGSFSYTIDGKRVETVNNVQQAALFINEVSNDAASGLVKIEVTCNSSNVFDFVIANKGTTSMTGYTPSFSEKTKGASYMDGKTLKNLYSVSVTVTITSIDDSRIKGTFSGTFKADKDDGGATANITDGSFNLPFMKS